MLGAEINFAEFTWLDVGNGTAVIVVGLFARFVVTFACARWSGWDRGTSAFVAFCWLPKATVQAALSTVALDYVRSSKWYEYEVDSHDYNDEEMEQYKEVS